MRRLRRARQRQSGQSLHRLRLAGRRRQRHHHRGPRRPERAAASDAGGVPRASRAAVRLLHPGHDHDRGGHGLPQGPRPRRSHHPSRARRQSLSLHRLPQHRQGDRGGRQSHGRAGAQDLKRERKASSREETAMSATGIGAAVRRREDQRFITGKGHYTDDVNRPGQCHAYFLRSPHAHAKIKSIDGKAAAAMPGVRAVLTGAELAADKVGNLICGWMIHSKDGSQMKMAPTPALAHGKANYVGDAAAVVVAETMAHAKDAAEKVKVDYEPLPALVDPAKAQGDGAPQIHEVAARNTIYQWHLGDPKAVEAAFQNASHVTKLDVVNNRLVPNAIEPRA